MLVRRPPPRYLLLALVPLLIIIVTRLRHLPVRFAYSYTGDSRPAATLRPAPSDFLLRWPGVYRGMCLAASGFVMVMFIVIIACLYYRPNS